MKRIVFVLAAVAALLLVGAGVGAAQQAPETNTTVEPTEEPGNSIRLDGAVTISSWEYENGAFRITFQADHPTHVTISEATQGVEGATSFAITRERLLSGENQVTLGVERVGGEAQVSITSAASIEEGRGVMISTGQTQQDRPPVAYGTAGLLAGGAALGTGWYSYRRGRAKLEESDEPEARRIA